MAKNKEELCAQGRAQYLRDRDKRLAYAKQRAQDPLRKAAKKEYNKQYKIKNKDKVKAAMQQWVASNRQAVQEYQKVYRIGYYIANKEASIARTRRNRHKNPGKYNAISRNYQASKARRIPRWLTKSDYCEIQWAYVISAEKTKLTGIIYQVDHIIPLNGRNVSGLHVPSNLRVITKTLNNKKKNKHESD